MNNKARIFIAFSLVIIFNPIDAWFFDLFSSGSYENSRPLPQVEYHYHVNSSSSEAYTTSDYMSERQFDSYVDQIMHAVNRAFSLNKSNSLHIANFIQIIKESVRSIKSATEQTGYGKRYKKDMVDQYINSAVLQYIEQESYSYAYKRTQNRIIAQKISESMRNNALALIDKNSVLNPERLAPFIGYALEKAVDNKLYAFDRPYEPLESNATHGSQNLPSAQPKPIAPSKSSTGSISSKPANTTNEKIYKSEDCCVCYESFSEVSRIFLRPCGHDICKKCAFDWFFGNNQKTTCPTCRAQVNLDILSSDII